MTSTLGPRVSAARGKRILRPGQALAQAFKRMRDFSGRSRRSAYWWFALFIFLGGFAFAIIDEFLIVPGLETWPFCFYLFSALVILPDLSLGIRRLHDTGRRGWLYVIWVIFSYGSLLLPEPDSQLNIQTNGGTSIWDMFSYGMIFYLAIYLVVFLLMLVMIFLLTRDSQKGQNSYGPNPKGIGNIDVFS